MFQWLSKWRQDRIVQRSLVTEAQWCYSFQNLPLLQRLNHKEKVMLKRLAILFLYDKSLEGVGELQVTMVMCLSIALQACLLILYLGLDWYDDWVSIIIYPEAFSRQSRSMDEYGIEHVGTAHLSGESWQRGPVILSWSDALHHGEVDGRNVVIHEFAHKLDMRNGSANGFPPLHKGMSSLQWTEVFSHAYDDFTMRIQRNDLIPINHYGARSAAEFFAVLTEAFFEKPRVIKQYYADVYKLLLQFYRQDPLS